MAQAAQETGAKQQAANIAPVELAKGILPPRGVKQHEFRIMIEARGAG